MTPEKRCFNQLERHLAKGRLDLFEGVLARARTQGVTFVWQDTTPWSDLPLETVNDIRRQRLRLWRAAAEAPDGHTVKKLVTAHPCLDLDPEYWQIEMETALRRGSLEVADWLLDRPGVKARLQRQDNPLHAWLGAASQRRDTAAIQWLWSQEGLSPPQDTPANPVLLEVSRMASLEPQMLDILTYLIQEKQVKITPAIGGPFAEHTPLTQLTTYYVGWQGPRAKSGHDAAMIRVWPLLVGAGDDPDRVMKDLPEGARHALAPYPAGQAETIMRRLADAEVSPPAPRRHRLRS